MPRRRCGADQHGPNATLRRPAGRSACPIVRGVAQVLVVEDDPTIRTALVRGLTERGHAVASAPTGLAGLEHAVGHRPDVVVLDLGLPDVDGTAVLRMLRAVSQVPVIVATARDDEAEIVAVLDAGADDYVVKPFGAAQLDARIRAVLRRGGRGPAGHRGRGRRAADRPAHPAGQRRGPPAGAHTPRVRPAALPRGPGRPGGHQARAAHRGVAAAVRRRGQDRRRAPVVAAPQARRDRAAGPLPAHASAASACGSPPPPGRPATGCDRCAGGCCCSSRPRPRWCWSRSWCRWRCWCARSPPSARCSPRPPTPRRSPRSSPSPTPPRWPSPSPRSTPPRPRRSASSPPDGAVLGAAAPRTPLVRARRAGEQRRPWLVDGGREIVFAVQRPAGADRGDPHVRHATRR